ncbi:hypothetical protein SAMN05443667_10266 [Flavobacterium gillisiae]|uniref:Uncharacterized protein n=1 Tax=Flavobacterium gillisiae TaxID=150146 RepID=A0A1H3YPS7_9FLAO|nr:hypothetical protein SAMN05443667_10266 [Flavobacterium gillisiae]
MKLAYIYLFKLKKIKSIKKTVKNYINTTGQTKKIPCRIIINKGL